VDEARGDGVRCIRGLYCSKRILYDDAGQKLCMERTLHPNEGILNVNSQFPIPVFLTFN
jgi:hypothetical protein